MTTPINANAAYSDTMTAHASAAGHAALTGYRGYVPLSPEGLLFFCQSQLRTLDDSIQKQMVGQSGLVALEAKVNEVEGTLKGLGAGGNSGDDKIAFDDPDKVKQVDDKLNEAIDAATQAGDGDLADRLKNVKTMLHAGKDGQTDNKVTKEDIKEMCSALDTATANCRSGAEINMIGLQSLISKRATMLQLTTGMMNSMNEGSKNIAGNVGR